MIVAVTQRAVGLRSRPRGFGDQVGFPATPCEGDLKEIVDSSCSGDSSRYAPGCRRSDEESVQSE